MVNVAALSLKFLVKKSFGQGAAFDVVSGDVVGTVALFFGSRILFRGDLGREGGLSSWGQGLNHSHQICWRV